MKNLKKIIVVVIILGIATLAALGVHIAITYISNHTEHTIEGNIDSADIYMDFSDRNIETGSWIKRDYELYGELVDLNAQTCDGHFYNNDWVDVVNWEMTIHIGADCFLNQAWNGNVEIHQFVGTEKEKVQRLYIQDYDLETLEVTYLKNDENLLIPLNKGDYIVYYPSEGELKIENGKDTGIGFIFYYLDELSLSDYSISYYTYRAFHEGLSYWIFITLCVALFTSVVVLIATTITLQIAHRTMELQKSSISCMSEIYDTIYMISLKDDTLVPVYVDEEAEKLRPKNIGAREQILNMFEMFAEDAYRDIMIEFTDLDTVGERLKNKNSIACEFISKVHGWSSIRFFVMDRVDGETPDKVLFTIQAIDDEKKQMDLIQERVEKAESENKAKSVFLANMSHEIRTPINAVLGFNTMILRNSKDKQIREYAKEIKSAGNMLLSLINGILDFSKLEAEKMELAPVEYSLSQVLYEVYHLTRTRMEAKGLEFRLEIAEHIPDKLWGDDLRLKQILVNLLTNAAKYTESGSVTLSLYGKAVGDHVHLLFSVKDTGIGIKEEDREKLTQRFARLEEGRNRNVEGTGIGLSLVSGLLQLMDSKLQVASTYGEGSEFYFEIDEQIIDAKEIGVFDLAAMESVEDSGADVSLSVRDATILVVDDNATNLLVMEELLSSTGLVIEKASSGMEALKKTASSRYDLIFMDHMMPEMDGIECFHRIVDQEDGFNQKTPVIMLTANALQGAKEEYEAEGFADFLAKPVQLSELEKKLVEYLPEEKVLDYQEGEPSTKETENLSLPDLEGVDKNYALSHIGSTSGVRKVMTQFASLYQADAEELLRYYDASDMENYRIKVHAMKSTANLFGALLLYGQAAGLEQAAREADREQIQAVTPFFLKAWTKMGEAVKTALSLNDENDDAAGTKELATEDLQALLHQLKTSMSTYDIKTADSLIEELAACALPKELAAKLDELKLAVSQMDAEVVAQICDQMSI